MRFSRSGSNDRRNAAPMAARPKTSEAMAICLLWRRQSLARASRVLSIKRCGDYMRMQNAKCKMQKWVVLFCILHFAFCIFGCARKTPLTAEKAKEIIGQYQTVVEPVYAEVPQRVWWSPRAPKDDYDELALRTLRNLEHAGYLKIEETRKEDRSEERRVGTEGRCR